jgi:hypothetical protein
MNWYPVSPGDGGPGDSYKITFQNRAVLIEGDPERVANTTA